MMAIPLIIMGISAAAAGVGIASALDQPSAPKAPTQATTNLQQAQASEAAAQAQASALMKRRGMASTELTSPMGTSGAAQTTSATLG